ncbi:MAG: hypothetical protein ACMXYM_04235 [Candidatus Woesearchaeota archaeon]
MEPETLSKVVSAIFNAHLARLQETNPDANAEDLHAALTRIDDGTSGADGRLAVPIDAVIGAEVGRTDTYSALIALHRKGDLRTIPGYNGTPQHYMLTAKGFRAAREYVGQS